MTKVPTIRNLIKIVEFDDQAWDFGRWKPTQEQLDAAQEYAETYYEGGSSEEDYSLGQFTQDIIDHYDTRLDLDEERLEEIHSYGEHENWDALTVQGFLRWRSAR
jgi:hypothetical protein